VKIYLLDTNIISEPTKESPKQILLTKLVENLEYSCISSITWAEILSLVKSCPNEKKRKALFDYYIENVQKQYELLSFDSSAANIYSDLFERLKSKGKAIQSFDLMLASIAISNNLILVTQKTAAFSDLAECSNLMLESWVE